MNRGDFQKLTQERLKDVEALLQKQRYSGAYYLCGYVIECALKACIAKQTKEFDFPPERKVIDAIYTYDLMKLIKSAGLEDMHNKDLENDKKLKVYWSVVERWSEASRYEECDQEKARDIYQAITDEEHGVLQWVRQRW
ncbi:MAG: DNA-binding protein [Planctomycetes bacterium RBG_16_55_9]|nr:MAG: DNA-binding protein [Planctomycetes bacterium RBG_16_55_9]